MTLQIRWCSRCPAPQQVLGAGHQDQRHPAQRLRHFALFPLFTPIDAHVEGLTRQPPLTVVKAYDQVDMRVAIQELWQDGQYTMFAVRGHCRQLHNARKFFVWVPQAIKRVFDHPERVRYTFKHDAAFIGQVQGTRRAQKQPHSQAPLKPGDTLTQSSCTERQPPCGRGKAAGMRDLHKMPEVSELLHGRRLTES